MFDWSLTLTDQQARLLRMAAVAAILLICPPMRRLLVAHRVYAATEDSVEKGDVRLGNPAQQYLPAGASPDARRSSCTTRPPTSTLSASVFSTIGTSLPTLPQCRSRAWRL
jgi:hypothetical protein